MKIENNDYNIVQDSSPSRIDSSAAARPESTSRPDRAGQTDDSVNISTTSQQINAWRDVVNAAPDLRTDRVSELKAAVQNRTYYVSGQQIADKILDGEQS